MDFSFLKFLSKMPEKKKVLGRFYTHPECKIGGKSWDCLLLEFCRNSRLNFLGKFCQNPTKIISGEKSEWPKSEEMNFDEILENRKNREIGKFLGKITAKMERR